MKKVTILFALLLFAVSQGAFAQKTITGKVINADDELGMVGVPIVVKGTLIGTTTDSDGNFTLKVPLYATLVVSFVGFKPVEMPVGDQTQFDVTLERDFFILDAVVVTARKKVEIIDNVVVTSFGIERDKKTLTTSIQMISGAELSRASDPNFMTALTGKVAGVNAVSDGNRTLMTTIRGIKSFYFGAQSPLFVVDGVPIATPRSGGGGYVDISEIVDMINIENIESITVLKSANAAILYGSQGVNGVILITTKKR